jgi:ABC-type dipeptide/oligopeptide/nickel transport system permease component
VQYFLRRLLVSVPTALVALVAVFVAIRVVPNNPALARFGQHAVPEQVAAEMQRRGWDRPVLAQLGDFIRQLATTGDLGESFFYPETVVDALRRTFPATVELAIAAAVIALPCGVLLGVAAAVWRNRWPDVLCATGALVGVSVPVFFLGIMLRYWFTGMPTGRRLPLGMGFDSTSGFILIESLLRGRFDVFVAALRHLCLPAIALATIPLALVARITRAAMLEVLSADYVRTARAKGSSAWRVVLRHALPNASIPVVSIAGLQISQLLTGAVLTETVFDWPGLGRRLVDAVLKSDYPVVQGATLLIAIVFVAMNLLTDFIYVLLDPRLRLENDK